MRFLNGHNVPGREEAYQQGAFGCGPRGVAGHQPAEVPGREFPRPSHRQRPKSGHVLLNCGLCHE
eukprot:10645012-Alexandrium_andersonii.AAC.1